MKRLLVVGGSGRLGSSILRQASADAGWQACGAGRGDELERLLGNCDVAIDVSQPAGTRRLLAAATPHGTPLVIGTTGHDEAMISEIRTAAGRVPLLLAPNFSVGVNLLFALTAQAARALGPDYRVEIVELHHERKRDAPSGTARRLGEIAAAAHGRIFSEVARHGRTGEPGPRHPDELGMHAVRGGDIIGEHTVFLIGPAERLELTHRAANRELFAQGALRAAGWLVGRPPGFYGMADALGLPNAP